jgi:splicing factor 3A subunit 1
MPPPPRPFLPAMPLPPPPPQLSAMPPPPPPEEAPPPPPEEPEPKRQKVDEFPLIPEDQFLAQHPVCASFLHWSWALEKSVMCS